MGEAQFRYCPQREERVVVLKRVRHIGGPGSTGDYTTYATHDGRFTVVGINDRGGRLWQAQARDGSTPFRGFGGKRNSPIYNGDTLDECREEITYAYELEAASPA